jgi:hypothetical protein
MRTTYIFGAGDIRVINVPDPGLQQPTDAIVRVVRACTLPDQMRTPSSSA